MSTSVGTMRAGTNKLPVPKDKTVDKSTGSQTATAKTESHSKMQPTQEQLRLAQMMSTNQTDADPNTVKQLMDMTGKSEDVVVIALHDAGNDADRAVMMLLEGGEEQGEWLEQGAKKKKKNTQKESSSEEQSDGRSKDRGTEKGGDNQDMPPRRGGRRNGVPPPRLARGRGRERGGFGDRSNFGDRDRGNFGDRDRGNFGDRDRGNFGDRDRGNFGDRDRGSFGDRDRGSFGDRDRGSFGDRDRGSFGDRDRGSFGDREKERNERNNAVEDWDNEMKDDKGPRNDRGDRGGRSRGRGGFGGGRKPISGPSSGRGRFNNSNDRENRGFTRPRRFEKMGNSQPLDGPEIDTWTNETAETRVTNKDTDWNSWNDTWVNEEDQWTGTLEETKVFTPSHVKMPEADPVGNEPPSSLGQRLDVGSLFENAKFSKAPDYSKPSGDTYINQFNQAATESIKNTIGIGNTNRPQIPLSPPNSSGSLGLTNLGQNTGQNQGGSVLSSLQQSGAQNSMPRAMAQLSQISQPASQSTSMSQIGMNSPPSQTSNNQAPQQSRIPSVVQQQQQPSTQPPQQQQQSQQQSVSQSSMNSMQQRPKPSRSKLPPPSKIPSTAVEMPGHIPRNPQLDVQFGLDFGSEPSVQFGFGGSGDSTSEDGSFSTATNGTTVMSNHLSQQSHNMSQSAGDGNSVSPVMPSPSAGSSNKVPPGIEAQVPSRQGGVFHNSVYSSPQKNDSQPLDMEQNKVNDSIPFMPPQLDRKSSPMTSQRQVPVQNSQNLSSGPMTSSKNDSTSAVPNNSYSSANGYSSSYQSHPKGSSISHTTGSQPPQQTSSFPGQYPVNQSAFPSTGQTQFPAPPNATPFPSAQQQPSQYNSSNSSQNQFPSGQSNSSQNQFPSGQSNSSQNQFPSGQSNSSQNQFSSGQNQYSVGTSTLAHQNQFPSAGAQNNYGGGPSQYSSYQNNSSFSSHPQSQTNYPSNQNGGTGAASSLYPISTQSGVSSYGSQSSSYQSPSAGSYHSSRDGSSNNVAVSTQQSNTGGMPSFPGQPQTSNLKPAAATPSQSNSSFNSQSFNANPTPLQPSSLANKLGESLSKMSMKDTAVLDNHQSSQYDHAPSAASVPASVSISSASSSASLSTGTNTISSSSNVTSVTSTSRVTSMPSTSGKAPPNLPPGVPLMGQYIMGQSTIPPFYSVQPPLYGYEDVQLLQQRMPMQTGSFYDVSAFPGAPAGSTLPTGRDQQPPIPSVPFSGTSDTKLARVDAQSPNASSQPQSAHSAAQQPLFNFHYGYYYPSMFPGAAGLQYPTTVYPIPPVTNAAPAHPGTTATTQFQKSYPSHVYTTKGYDDVNQVQDFSKTGYGSSQSSGKPSGTRSGTNEITPNAYNKSHGQAGFDKQGYHGGTPPPFNLPMASASQTGPMGAPTTPYGAPFMPVMAAHQPHSQMMHHPIQQDSNNTSSRGMNPAAGQGKSGAAKSFGGPPYWNN